MTDSETTEAKGLAAAWRWWLPPALLTLVLALLFMDPFAGDWDALDYTVLAVNGQPSSMILGRMLFIFTNHVLWRTIHALFALPPEQAYLLFKYAVIVESPLATIAWWRLTSDLTGSVRAATIAAFMLALSPFYIIYSGQAMTEIPSLLLLAIALTVHLRGLRRGNSLMVLIGAALLGLGVNVREGVGLFAPWLVFAPLACGWKLKPREIVTSPSSPKLMSEPQSMSGSLISAFSTIMSQKTEASALSKDFCAGVIEHAATLVVVQSGAREVSTSLPALARASAPSASWSEIMKRLSFLQSINQRGAFVLLEERDTAPLATLSQAELEAAA
jgi:hypothetical protein